MRWLRQCSLSVLPHKSSLIIGMMLTAHLVTSLGFPLPFSPNAKDLSQPFPCQHRSCGCRNAEHCWKSCCCFTAQERLTWAQKHQVEPPPSLLMEAKTETTNDPAHCSACSECNGETHPFQSPEESAPSCCSAPAKQPQPTDPDENRGSLSWVIGSQAMRCRGLALGWLLANPALPPTPHLVWSPDFQPVGWLRPSNNSAPFLSFPPAQPPPRS
jgi:hypothetical protein